MFQQICIDAGHVSENTLYIRAPLMVFPIIHTISFVLILGYNFEVGKTGTFDQRLAKLMVNSITFPNSNTLFWFYFFFGLILKFFGSFILKESEYIRLSNSNKMREIKYFIYNLKEGNTNMQIT